MLETNQPPLYSAERFSPNMAGVKTSLMGINRPKQYVVRNEHYNQPYVDKSSAFKPNIPVASKRTSTQELLNTKAKLGSSEYLAKRIRLKGLCMKHSAGQMLNGNGLAPQQELSWGSKPQQNNNYHHNNGDAHADAQSDAHDNNADFEENGIKE